MMEKGELRPGGSQFRCAATLPFEVSQSKPSNYTAPNSSPSCVLYCVSYFYYWDCSPIFLQTVVYITRTIWYRIKGSFAKRELLKKIQPKSDIVISMSTLKIYSPNLSDEWIFTSSQNGKIMMVKAIFNIRMFKICFEKGKSTTQERQSIKSVATLSKQSQD